MRHLLLIPLLLLSGCALDFDGKNRPVTTTIEAPLDGVKWITPSIDVVDDPRAYLQSTYEISSDKRLLLRYEKLAEFHDKISTDPGKGLRLEVSTPAPGPDGPSPLTVCPVTHNWTMHATWQVAHPFGGKGIWQQAGGDYSITGCVVGQQKGFKVSFDVTRWYIDHSRGKGVNWGLILVSETPVTIRGERTGEDSPRLFFEKWVRP